MAVPTVKPQGTRTLSIPCSLPRAAKARTDYRLNLSFRLKRKTLWSGAGHEVAWAQFELPARATRPARRIPKRRLAFNAQENRVVAAGPGWELTFDCVRGVISRWRVGDRELLLDGPAANFWRAPLDNDHKVARKWRDQCVHLMRTRIDSVECEQIASDIARIRVKARHAPAVHDWGILCDTTYTIHGAGDVILDWQGRPDGAAPPLPRIGLQMTVPKPMNRVTWYGRGPGESYADSKQAGKMDVHDSTIKGLFTPYVYPQESGNRMDVRWLALCDRGGTGLLVAGSPSLNFSAHEYTTQDLEEAKHLHELKARDFITLNLDYRQRGLGSASCGPDVLAKYELNPEPFRMALQFKQVLPDSMPLTELAKIR